MKRTLSLILALAMLFALAACAPSAQTTPSEAASTAAESASSETASSSSEDAKPEKYVVGVPTLLTGAWAELGIAASNGIKLALEDVNAEGGIHGIPVELEIMDTASDNAQAVDVAKKLIEDSRIIGIASADGTGNSIAAMPYYEEAQMVFISSMASSNSFAPSSNYAFTCSGMVINEVQCTANMLGEFMGAKKVAMVYVNSDWGASFIEGFGDELAKYGAELVACESYNDGEKDFSALLTKIRQTEPDALFIAGQYADTAAIVNTIKQMNWDVIFTGTGAITNQQFMDLVGSNAEGMLAYSATVWTDEYPFAVELSDRYYKAYGTYPDVYAAAAYEAFVALCDAANTIDHDNFTRAELRDAVEALQELRGVNGNMTWDSNGNTIKNYGFIQVVDGEWTVVGYYKANK